MQDIKYMVLLHNLWVTHKKFHEVFRSKKDFKVFYHAINHTFLKKHLFSEKQIENILEKYKKIDIWYIEEQIEKNNVEIVTFFSKEYPEALKNISNPPFFLYIQWKIESSPMFSVVWSRNISSYWKKCIEHIIPEVWKYFTIVSGWATWCDSHAHITSLDHGRNTIAVVGTGIDLCYPTSNKKLFSEIVSAGWAIISIFPFSEPANRYNFPVRNEIVSGLSVWTLVIEAQEKSGSLITANLSLDLWRDVFACPWDIFRGNSQGCNNLILSWWAKITTSAQDILHEYNIKNTDVVEAIKEKVIFDNDIDKKIYELLLLDSLTIDEITKKMDIQLSTIVHSLSLLEIQWHICQSNWWKYELN